MKYCDDCKWCSVNFIAADNYDCPTSSDSAEFYKCMHPKSSEGARYDCKYCSTMRIRVCGREALLFEEKDKVLPQDQVNEIQPKKRLKKRKRYELFDVVETVLFSLTIYNVLLWGGSFIVKVLDGTVLWFCGFFSLAMIISFALSAINICCMDKYERRK